MELLFSDAELKNSSLTGKPSHACPNKPPKPALNPVKVKALKCKFLFIEIV